MYVCIRCFHNSQKIAQLELTKEECDKWNENFHYCQMGSTTIVCVYMYIHIKG